MRHGIRTASGWNDENGLLFKCAHCQTFELVFFWLKNDVWNECEKTHGDSLGKICLPCFEKFIRRTVTLEDLSIRSYLNTAGKTNGRLVAQETVRGTVIGACLEIGLPIPNGWTTPFAPPHTDSPLIGRYLVKRTADPNSVVQKLVAESNEHFPVEPTQADLDWLKALGRWFVDAEAPGWSLAQLRALARTMADSPAKKTEIASKLINGRKTKHAIFNVSASRVPPGSTMIHDGIVDGVLAAIAKRAAR